MRDMPISMQDGEYAIRTIARALPGFIRFDIALAPDIGKLGEKGFRARQIAEWLYQKNAESFDEMTNLPIAFRDKLDKKFMINSLSQAVVEKAPDGTRKFAFDLTDGNRIESVLIPWEDRLTLCVSSQAGCKLGCKFCLTGQGGFTRNLDYRAARTDQFWNYFHNRTPLFDAVFAGPGFFLRQEAARGRRAQPTRRFWASVWNTGLKVLGL